MIEVQVLNLENLVPVEFVSQLSEANVIDVLKDVVNGARDYWVQLAMDRFHTTQSQYVQGIQEVEWRGNDVAVISLVGMLPNILEQGMDRKDMHETLLGPNVPTAPRGQKGKHPRKEGGYYRAI